MYEILDLQISNYLLIWNKDFPNWSNSKLIETVKNIREGHHVVEKWSCQQTPDMKRGDRVFIFRKDNEPEGIIGSGWIIASPFEAPHWNEELARTGKKTLLVRFRVDVLFNPKTDMIILRENLMKNPDFVQMQLNEQEALSIKIPENLARELEKMLADLIFPLLRS